MHYTALLLNRSPKIVAEMILKYTWPCFSGPRVFSRCEPATLSIPILLPLGLVTCTTVAKQADRKLFCSTEVQEGHAVTRLAGSAVPAKNRAQPPGLMQIINSFILLTLYPRNFHQKQL